MFFLFRIIVDLPEQIRHVYVESAGYDLHMEPFFLQIVTGDVPADGRRAQPGLVRKIELSHSIHAEQNTDVVDFHFLFPFFTGINMHIV